MKNIRNRLANTLLKTLSGSLRSLAELVEVVAVQVDMRRTMAFEWDDRPDDVFIVTYPRSGTTLMQMMLYQLTTDGNMDFQHISMVVPWYERRIMSNPEAAISYFAALPSPRVFKCHLPYSDTPKTKGKYIYVMRDGLDVMVSYYHFYRSHLSFQGTFDDFFDAFMAGRVQFQSWFKHVLEWWQHRDDPDVLFLKYEEIIGNLDDSIRKVADFCGVEVSPQRLAVVKERCAFSFMKVHENKFDHTTGLALDRGYQLEAFIRKGKKGSGELVLSPEQKEKFDRVMRKYLGDCISRP